jgi:hypothetical protein
MKTETRAIMAPDDGSLHENIGVNVHTCGKKKILRLAAVSSGLVARVRLCGPSSPT